VASKCHAPSFTKRSQQCHCGKLQPAATWHCFERNFVSHSMRDNHPQGEVECKVSMLDWKQRNRRKGGGTYHERHGHKKINKLKDDLFWSRIGSEIRGGGPKRNMSCWLEGGGRQWMGRQEEAGASSKLSCGASATAPWGKCPICVWGGTC